MNPKAEIGAKTVFYAFVIILLVIIFMLFTAVIIPEKIFQAKIPEGVETFLFSERFLNVCFAYTESPFVESALPVIDFAKFNKDSLNSCYPSDASTTPQYRLTLQAQDSDSISLTTTLWADDPQQGKTMDVHVFKDGVILPGTLRVEE